MLLDTERYGPTFRGMQLPTLHEALRRHGSCISCQKSAEVGAWILEMPKAMTCDALQMGFAALSKQVYKEEWKHPLHC